MTSFFCLSFRFLDEVFHGRGEGGDPEWPPSPLRAFQALVCAAASRWRQPQFDAHALPALEWLERLASPIIIAPVGRPATSAYRTYVPNNQADLVAAAWVRRNVDASIADYRVEKDIRPTWLDGGETVHYLFPFPDSRCPYFEVLSATARTITHLGWGLDMAVGYASVLTEEAAAKLPGERWRPTKGLSPNGLRVPTLGTLNDLVAKHTAFLNRLSEVGFNPVPPLTVFRVVGYRRPTDTASRPFVAFELRTPDFEKFRPFNPTRHACAVAGMVRNALAELARDMRPFGLATDKDLNPFINTFIHGHTPDGKRPAQGPDADRRFAYLPLPSREHRGGTGVVVTAIRRVLVVGPPGRDREVAWARVLSGRELTPLNKHTPPAALRIIEKPVAALRRDPNLGPYVGEATVWSTVTPMVLPGHDEAAPETIARRVRLAPDHAARQRVREKAVERTKRLLRLAFEQAGWPQDLVAEAKLEWQSVGFRAGVERVDRYFVPDSLNQFPRYHIRVRWPVPVRGPLAVGAGRYRGLGVFAAES